MGFWCVPELAALTGSAMDPRLEFVLCVAAACAASDIDSRTSSLALTDAAKSDLSQWGATTPMNRAYSFLIAWRDARTKTQEYRAGDRAVGGLKRAGAVDVAGGGVA